MKKVILLCITIGTLLWAVDPWTGTLGPVPWWVRDNSSYQGNHAYRGICVVNDSVVWVVGETGQVWKRTGGMHSPTWTQVSITGAGDYHLNDVYFVAPDTGWIVGEKKAEPNKYRGIVYKTMNGGITWDSIIPLPSPPNLPTPFLKVQMANVSEGYISCGNGMILWTGNGGNSWTRLPSPWQATDSISVWYHGLWVDPNHPDTLWVSGDAFGIMSKSTNSGASWTAYQPDVFKQSYTFPQSAQTPHDPRLANYDAHFSSMNNGVVALSYGRIGKTTNGGTSWDTTCYEPQPTWFYDATNDGSTNLTIGNWGAIHQFNGTDRQENINHRWYFDNNRGDYRCVDNASSDYAYAAGTSDSATVRKRYQPAVLQDVTARVVDWNGTLYHIRVECSVSDTHNIVGWRCAQWIHNYLLRTQLVNFTSTPSWDFYLHEQSSQRANYYYDIYVETNDSFPYQEVAVAMIDSSDLDSLLNVYSPPNSAYWITADDVPNDQGHAIKIQFEGEHAPYLIGRSTDSLGPYYRVSENLTPSGDTVVFIDTTVQTGVRYYYVVMRLAFPTMNPSDYTGPDSATAVDNMTPGSPDNLTGDTLLSANLIKLEWSPPNPDPGDIAGYWVCPIPPGESDFSLNHASPIDRTIFYLPIDSTWQGWCEFFVAAMDYAGHISGWSDPCSVYVATAIDTSSSDKATAYNGGRNMIRVASQLWAGGQFWVCYESNGSICVKRSTDEGKTWSSRMQLGSGYNPCIGANVFSLQENPPACVVWWAQGSNDTLYFSKYVSGTSWTSPTVLVTSSNDFGPPSIVVGSDDYCYCAYQDGSTIKYIRFDIDDPEPGTPDSVGQGTDPSLYYMTPGYGYPEIHVAWDKDDSLYYRAKKLSTGWNASEKVLASGQHPSLEVVGSVIHIVCEGAGTDIWHCKATYTAQGHRWSSAKLYDTNDPSKYPVITGGSACAWVEELRGNKEIYYSYYDTENGWTIPQNTSETSNNSAYPHIAHTQTQSETKVYFMWTENNSSPYTIIFRWDAFDGGGRDDGGVDLPYYVADCGEELACGFNLRRDGYIQYGKETWQRIDYDAEYLEYQFEKLNPYRDYALEAYFYHGYNEPVSLTAQVDNTQIAAVNLNAYELITRKAMLPASMTEDGVVNVKICGDEPVSAILALYEYEPEAGKGMGGPQSFDTRQIPGRLSLHMPNPIVKRALISYELPLETDATLKVYDITGALRREISLTNARTGSVIWDGKDNHGRFLATGIYFCRLEAGGRNLTEKVVFLR